MRMQANPSSHLTSFHSAFIPLLSLLYTSVRPRINTLELCMEIKPLNPNWENSASPHGNSVVANTPWRRLACAHQLAIVLVFVLVPQCYCCQYCCQYYFRLLCAALHLASKVNSHSYRLIEDRVVAVDRPGGHEPHCRCCAPP